MAVRSREEREAIAERRIINVLRTQGVANLRTLEQKIADAGPNPQRIQPHILTPVKNRLVKSGRIVQLDHGNAQWLHLSDESPVRVAHRTAELQDLWTDFVSQKISRRTGQALEISIFRAIMAADGVVSFGGFADLTAHGDDKLYSKQEIHNFDGKTLGKLALDFIIAVGGSYCGIEAKNIRQWLYPNDQEIKDAIRKARTLGVIPVIVARRIPFVTFRILGTCGVIMHETFNQRMANADADLAEKVKEKTLLGYHDVRVGNDADDRLMRFIGLNLPSLVGPAKIKLDQYGDLLDAFSTNSMRYAEFAARVRRRESGQKEDNDWPDRDSLADPNDW